MEGSKITTGENKKIRKNSEIYRKALGKTHKTHLGCGVFATLIMESYSFFAVRRSLGLSDQLYV